MPESILPAVPEIAEWTQLDASAGGESFYAGAAEIELIHAELVDGAVFNPPRSVIDELAEDWLDTDYGHDAACEIAVDEGGA